MLDTQYGTKYVNAVFTHVELVDREQYGAHDQRSQHGPRQVRSIDDAAGTFGQPPPRR